MISTKRAFTLIELLVVVGMIAVILGALTFSVNAANERARIQKATSEVKVISQAILAYENWNGDKLPTMGSRGKAANGAEANASSLDFLLGRGSASGIKAGKGAAGSSELPVLLMAQLKGGNALRDPWNTPYRVSIVENPVTIKFRTVNSTLQTGYWLPNFYRLSEDEQ